MERVPVQVAAEILGMSALSVQGALIHQALPIGGAWKNEGSTCYTYHIVLRNYQNTQGLMLKI